VKGLVGGQVGGQVGSRVGSQMGGGTAHQDPDKGTEGQAVDEAVRVMTGHGKLQGVEILPPLGSGTRTRLVPRLGFLPGHACTPSCVVSPAVTGRVPRPSRSAAAVHHSNFPRAPRRGNS
jgi:hypothetical protein